MSETCMVCLLDFDEDAPTSPVLPIVQGDEGRQGEIDEDGAATVNQISAELASVVGEPDVIAHVLPCGHNFHHECLKPWVERANSCPMCRQTFKMVELKASLQGPITSSYEVEDRVQTADIDPSMYLNPEDDQPCPRCGENNEEDVMLLCDGCDGGYHLYCVGLEQVPQSQWFCEWCTARLSIEPAASRTTSHAHRSSDRRTRRQQRQLRRENDYIWQDVWREISDQLDTDISFSSETVHSSGHNQLSNPAELTRRRQHRQWERRVQVAERQGGSNHFGETVSLFFDIPVLSRPPPERPEPESAEEILAWDAFEKAKELESDPKPSGHKRKSITNSPVETDSVTRNKRRRTATTSPTNSISAVQSERPLKRPQTRRAENLAVSAVDLPRESSVTRPRSVVSSRNEHAVQEETAGYTPSFLQSLLKEVESSAAPDQSRGQRRPPLSVSSAIYSGYSSPQSSSPGGSPTASNHPSPRALSITPPPSLSGRPGSPLALSSNVEPAYPPPEFSPERSPPCEYYPIARSATGGNARATKERRSRSALPVTNGSSPSRSEEQSPRRVKLSLAAKEEVQRVVKDALKIPYQNKEISKVEYTEINRSVSRMLYDKIGHDGNLSGETAETWKQLASKEVNKAMQAIQPKDLT